MAPHIFLWTAKKSNTFVFLKLDIALKVRQNYFVLWTLKIMKNDAYQLLQKFKFCILYSYITTQVTVAAVSSCANVLCYSNIIFTNGDVCCCCSFLQMKSICNSKKVKRFKAAILNMKSPRDT